MKPWLTLDTAQTPDGAPLTLQQRGDELVIRAGGQVLMSSRTHGSEEQLARIALEKLGGDAQVLIGGLGMGYTARAALDRLGPKGRVLVAELIPAIVAWNRGPLSKLAGRPLDDRRTEVFEGDVRAALERGPFDAVVLDVDNGPSALTAESNASLYGKRWLARFREALRPGGRFAVWSAAPEPAFARRLKDAGFLARMVPAGGRHVIFLAERGRAATPA